MAAKKKTVKVAKALTFNKATAKLFADDIYSDKHGRVTFLKLCNGNLSNGKDGGRTLHCALGEAYSSFVGTGIVKFINAIEKKHGDDINDNHSLKSEDRYNPKYSAGLDMTSHIPTLSVVDALVDVAHLKSKTPEAKKNLAKALLLTMEANDDSCGAGAADSLERSERVAEIWREYVIPLLK